MHVPFMSTQEVSNITVGCVSSDGILPAHGGGIMNTERVRRKYNKYIKHFQKMYRDVGMAVPKTTETRCRDGSVQGRHVIQRLHN